MLYGVKVIHTHLVGNARRFYEELIPSVRDLVRAAGCGLAGGSASGDQLGVNNGPECAAGEIYGNGLSAGVQLYEYPLVLCHHIQRYGCCDGSGGQRAEYGG